jgi:hypothetical protein
MSRLRILLWARLPQRLTGRYVDAAHILTVFRDRPLPTLAETEREARRPHPYVLYRALQNAGARPPKRCNTAARPRGSMSPSTPRRLHLRQSLVLDMCGVQQ